MRKRSAQHGRSEGTFHPRQGGGSYWLDPTFVPGRTWTARDPRFPDGAGALNSSYDVLRPAMFEPEDDGDSKRVRHKRDTGPSVSAELADEVGFDEPDGG